MSLEGLIVKIIAAALLLIILVLGYHAHFQSSWTAGMGTAEGRAACRNSDNTVESYYHLHKSHNLSAKVRPVECPSSAIPMEIVFLVITTVCLIASILSIVMELSTGQEMGGPECDGGYHGTAGVLICVAGILIIASAAVIDAYLEEIMEQYLPGYKLLPKQTQDEVIKKGRKKALFFNKLAAGTLAIIDAFIYLIAGFVICGSY